MSVGLRQYPQVMEELTLQHHQQARTERDVAIELKQMEDDLRRLIAAETLADDTRTKRFTNEAQRDAALRIELRSNADYIDLQSRLDAANDERVKTAAYMERLRREQRLLMADYEHEQRIAAIAAELNMRFAAVNYEVSQRNKAGS